MLAAQVPFAGSKIDLAPSLGHLALEVIGQVGLGHSFRALDGDNEYIRAANELVYVHCSMSY